MKLKDAQNKINKIANIPFSELLSPEQLEGITVNKGKAGQLLELTIGLNLSNSTLDFEDGELKTNKCDTFQKPLETMFITQISQMIDDLLNEQDFYESILYKKLKNLLYVPICKVGSPRDWFFFPSIHVQLDSPEYAALKQQLEIDYYTICRKLNEHIKTTGNIHTSNGEFIQIRSKDSKPYSPIFSNTYNTYISNKNHAFYFKKEFMKYINSF